MIAGVSVQNDFAVTFKVLLEDVSISRLDSLVVILFQIHDLEAKLLVELDGALVVHLNVSKIKKHSMLKSFVVVFRGRASEWASTHKNMLSKFPSHSTYLRM